MIDKSIYWFMFAGIAFLFYILNILLGDKELQIINGVTIAMCTAHGVIERIGNEPYK